jgi:hypothetical protein
MSQRDSGYARIERDNYETPHWVTHALMLHIPVRVKTIWEPAAGRGQMVAALESKFYVEASDITTGCDFLSGEHKSMASLDAIITNPPYTLAERFIEHALLYMAPVGFVAMLLRTDYDHARSRIGLFKHSAFAKKLILTERIRWFEGSSGSPSFNHAWFIWDWQHKGPPTLAYH